MAFPSQNAPMVLKPSLFEEQRRINRKWNATKQQAKAAPTPEIVGNTVPPQGQNPQPGSVPAPGSSMSQFPPTSPSLAPQKAHGPVSGIPLPGPPQAHSPMHMPPPPPAPMVMGPMPRMTVGPHRGPVPMRKSPPSYYGPAPPPPTVMGPYAMHPPPMPVHPMWPPHYHHMPPPPPPPPSHMMAPHPHPQDQMHWPSPTGTHT